jgi:hypothetical protein
MAIFYIRKMNESKVVEIRRSVKMNGTMQYIVDRPGGVNFVSQQEFISIPRGYRMNRIQ